MAYRNSKKYVRNAAVCERMRAAKASKRMESPAPDYPPILPDLRRTIIVIDYDKEVFDQHQIDLYKTNRIDQFRAVVPTLSR